MGATVMDQVDRLRAALADRYELDREIGHGGMAYVYRAHDRQHDRDVAIKVLRPELSAVLGTERFLREIHIEASLQHPHILPLYDSGSADGLLYYVMPYIPGETLRDLIRREKQLPLPDALQIIREVADALGYAHSHNVLHRDIKPANILLSGEHAVVADFGIAKAVSAVDEEALTGTGIAVGTPEYMSPEQASGDHGVDRRSDIYALGCVLFEMLAGQPPFTGRTAQSIIARHRQEPPPSLRVVRPTVPPEVERVVETALAKVPADRYSTTAEFTRALTTPVASAPRGLVGKTTAPRRRRVVVAATLAVLAALVAALFWRTGMNEARAADPNRVAVFPLVDRRASTADNRAGEAVAIMIGSALEHTEPLKWIDGWTLLDPRQREDVRLLSSGSARELSLQQRARYYVDGSLVLAGDSTTVILRLHDATGDSVMSQASASGASDMEVLPQTGLRAITNLLPVLLEPGRRLDPSALSALANRRPAAIADWLQGEREYRRSRFGAALTYFRRAVEVDSALAVAALRGAQASGWLERPDESQPLLKVASAHETLLPSRYVELANAWQSYYAGAADSAVIYFQSALAADSTSSELWMGLGDVYYHLLPHGTSLDSLAEAAFLRARQADTSFTPPLFHLAEIALRRGQVARADTLIGWFQGSVPDSALSLRLRLMRDCVQGGVGLEDWKRAAIRDAYAVMQAAKGLSAGVVPPSCAIDGFRAVLASPGVSRPLQWGSLLGLQCLLVAAGKYGEVERILDSASADGFPDVRGLYVLDATVGAGMRDKAASVVAELGGRYESMGSQRLWYHAIWASDLGETQKLRAITRALQANAARSGTASDSLVAEVMGARMALLDADTAGAVRILERIRPVGTPFDIVWGFWQSLGAERLILARLLLAQGRNEEAIDVAEVLDHQAPISYLLYLPSSLALRIEAADRLGRTKLSSRYRARLAALHQAL